MKRFVILIVGWLIATGVAFSQPVENTGIDPLARSNVSANTASDAAKVTAAKDPTGFESPDLITSTYDGTAGTITLVQSGGVILWFKGQRINLGTPWVSPSNVGLTGNRFLYFDADNSTASAAWSNSNWNFYDAQVAAIMSDGYEFCHQEHHGLMAWETHETNHYNIGTFRMSGLTPTAGTYAVASSTISDANNTPGFDAGVIDDEDLPTTIASWPEDTYSIMTWSGTGTTAIATDATKIVNITGTYPDYYAYSGGTFTKTEMGSSNYANVYQICLPVSLSVNCQRYRTIIIQPQNQYTSLAAAQAEDFRQLNLGQFTSIAPEFVAFTRFTIRTSASYGAATGRFRIEAVSYLTGSKATQVTISSLVVPNDASAINNSVTNFGGILSSADTTVQAALDTIDDWMGSTSRNFSAAKLFLNTSTDTYGLNVNATNLLAGFWSSAASSLFDFIPTGYDTWRIGAGVVDVNDFGIYNITDGRLDFQISGTGNASFSQDIYVTGTCSALAFEDRSAFPDSISDAYEIINSHEGMNGRLDHSKLSSKAWGTKSVQVGTIQKQIIAQETKSIINNGKEIEYTEDVVKTIDEPVYESKPDQSKRNLSMTISALCEVVKDQQLQINKLTKLINKLENK